MEKVVEHQRQHQHVHINLSPQFTLYVAIPLAIAALCMMWFLWQFVQWLISQDGWGKNWLVLSLTGAVLLLGIFAKPIVQGIFAIRQHRQDIKDRVARRNLLDVQAQALLLNAQRGFNTELSNTITGDMVKVINPMSIAPASRTTNNYLEGPAGEEDEEYEEVEIEQPTIDEIIPQIERNSYKICLGRSLTTGELIIVNLVKKHLKFIGASQRGKSSAAAALMKTITLTHDPEYVQLALLDLENLTCHLFEDLPHVATFNVNGKEIPLVARSHEEVAEHLDYLVEIMNYRYTLSKREVMKLPIILVYLEELIALKDYFKSRCKAKIEGADADYANLCFCIKELARRGLKARIQLLACAQSDYRDDDLVEAWINIKNGLSFSVKPSAAQAAGFMNYELLVQNAEDDEPGQFVCEMSEIKDLGLAPYFDLEKLLVAWEEEQDRLEERQVEGSIAEYQRPYLVASNGQSVSFQETVISEEISANERRWAENREAGTDDGENWLEKGLPVSGSLTSETSQAQNDGKYRFSEAEQARVVDLYKAYNNIDKVLRHMKRGARWQNHASEILKEAGLL